VDAQMTEIPVWALAGSIVPMYPDGVMTLVTEPAPDRVVAAFAGASGAFTEIDGVTYALTSAPTSVGGTPGAATWNGAPLSACATAPTTPCVMTSPNVVQAYVRGSGTLSVAGLATLVVSNAGASANETLSVRY
jgi:hypothetical protein